MNKSQLALSLIRPTLASKLTDRAWVIPVLFAAFILLAAFLGRMPFSDAVNAVLVLVGGPAAAEKFKDALIGSAAVRGDAPQSVAVNNVGADAATAPNDPKLSPQSELIGGLKSAIANSAENYAGAQLDKVTGVSGLSATLGVGAPASLPRFADDAEVAR